MQKRQKLVKKKATKKEIEELRNIIINVRKDDNAMMQIRKLISQTT